MKVAIVNLAEQFGIKALKQRPCLIISESKKHAKVCLFTHNPIYRKNMYGIIRMWHGYLDTNDIFIVRKEFITDRYSNPINPNKAQEIKRLMKNNPHNVYCVNYDNFHTIEKRENNA